MQDMPKDMDQRKRFVRDRRAATEKAEKKHKAKVEASEHEEIFDNVDRAWRKNGHTVGNPMFSGIGPGIPGSMGRWVRRDGETVRA